MICINSWMKTEKTQTIEQNNENNWNLEVESNKEVDLMKTQIEIKLKTKNLEWKTKPQK